MKKSNLTPRTYLLFFILVLLITNAFIITSDSFYNKYLNKKASSVNSTNISINKNTKSKTMELIIKDKGKEKTYQG